MEGIHTVADLVKLANENHVPLFFDETSVCSPTGIRLACFTADENWLRQTLSELGTLNVLWDIRSFPTPVVERTTTRLQQLMVSRG